MEETAKIWMNGELVDQLHDAGFDDVRFVELG